MTAIELKGLTKAFGDKTAVDNVSLTVEEGELFGLLGVNGAGKSTTIKMLSCLLALTSGDALVCGESILYRPEQVKKVINVSPQETAVAPNLTVWENLLLMAELYGKGRAAAEKKAAEVAELFSLGEVARQRAKTLSGGWQRRLSIAMALVSEPRVLFLDEPTLGLDVLARRELWHILEALKSKTTIVLTTHYLEEAERLSDRIAILAKGRIKAIGTPAELKVAAGTGDFEEAFIHFAGGERDAL